jgi:flagellar FliL protein
MAETKQAAAPAPAAAAAQAPAKKKLPKKLILMVAAGLLLTAGAAGAYVMLIKKPAPAGEQAKKPEAHKLPNFVDLEQFTVNLAEKDQDRYMQIKFSLEVAPAEAEATIKEMMPALRSEILLVLGARESSELASREGKEKLAKDIVDAANKSLEHTAADHAVSAVRITQLIVQ